MAAAPTVLIQDSLSPRKEAKSEGRPAHHQNDTQTLFTNPWPSFGTHFQLGAFGGIWAILSEWKRNPMPPKEEFVRVAPPTWALDPAPETWAGDIKATWLGHACFLVEFPASLPSTPEAGADIGAPARGPRVLFDPVFSQRCSPNQWFGPKRLTPPPMPLKELPHVDLVVLSHDHYDHTDTNTLQHIYAAQPKGSVHFLCPLGNLPYFKSLGIASAHVSELDWWDARDATISLPGAASTLTVTCTPAQHFSGRGLTDRMQTLWASWAVEQHPSTNTAAGAKVWFGGDTGVRAVPRGFTGDEDTQPVCPAFAQIGERFGGFDLALVPIGAFSPRGALSPVHASPADAVLIHKAVRSRKSIGMHWGCWMLSDEPFMQDPKRLKEACAQGGVDEGEFVTVYVGETVRQTPV